MSQTVVAAEQRDCRLVVAHFGRQRRRVACAECMADSTTIISTSLSGGNQSSVQKRDAVGDAVPRRVPRATRSAARETSLAIRRARRQLGASATAMQPLPVPTSTMSADSRRVAGRRRAPLRRRARFPDAEISTSRRDLELETPEFAVADDVARPARGLRGGRSARRSARSKAAGAGSRPRGEEPARSQSSDVAREHLGIARGFLGRDACRRSARAGAPRARSASERHRKPGRLGRRLAASLPSASRT